MPTSIRALGLRGAGFELYSIFAAVVIVMLAHWIKLGVFDARPAHCFLHEVRDERAELRVSDGSYRGRFNCQDFRGIFIEMT